MSEAPHRYTADVADEIERRWQQRWDEEGTFYADNPVGELRGTVKLVGAVAEPVVDRLGADHRGLGLQLFRRPAFHVSA